MSADDVRRAITRIAHEIVERNHGLEDLALVALQTGGTPIAERLQGELERIEGTAVPLGTLDVAFYRDDNHQFNEGEAVVARLAPRRHEVAPFSRC